MYSYKPYEQYLSKLSNTNKIHIWYGGGGTGKSRCLNHFINNIIGSNNVYVTDLDSIKLSKLKNKTCIVINDSDIEGVIKKYIKHNDKTKLWIITTNIMPNNINNYLNYVELSHFTHKF